MLLQALTTVVLAASSTMAAKYTWYGEAGSPGYGSASGACGRNYVADDFLYYAAFTVNGLPDKSSIVNSGYCGRCLRVSADSSAVVMITDVMMREDADPDDIDLSPTAFNSVVSGGLGQGIAFGSWSWTDCGSIGGSGGGSDPAPEPAPPVDPAPVDPVPPAEPSPEWVDPTTSAWVEPQMPEPTTTAWVEPQMPEPTTSAWVEPQMPEPSPWVEPAAPAPEEVTTTGWAEQGQEWVEPSPAPEWVEAESSAEWVEPSSSPEWVEPSSTDAVMEMEILAVESSDAVEQAPTTTSVVPEVPMVPVDVTTTESVAAAESQPTTNAPIPVPKPAPSTAGGAAAINIKATSGSVSNLAMAGTFAIAAIAAML
ncbi:hypothetical protein BJ741DRAFT_648235 [Chytriomyces cf. hyalinus JEL632]|nr:hypothetical protein BJ741DRAFT_648235 [Chytriomyces cf. hyalinus JEL632]